MTEERLRVRIMAPAVDNRANKALIEYVAKALGIKPGCISLRHGATSRLKTLRITSSAEPAWEALFPDNLL